MNIETVGEATNFAEHALASLRGLSTAPTPQHFAIWYEYHRGQNRELNRVIDILLANRSELSEAVLDEIYDRFFATTVEHKAVRETSRRVQETLKAVVGHISDAKGGAGRFNQTLTGISGELRSPQHSPFEELVARLSNEMAEMTRHTELLDLRLTQSSVTIEQLRSHLETVRKDAMTDGLTGIANRKMFDISLRECVTQALDEGAPLSLLMLDIDHFKAFNDSWGHDTGDDVLRLVARMLIRNIKGQDLASRFGGEEFTILLPRTGLQDATSLAETIRRAFVGRRIVKKDTGTIVGAIAVSIGVAQYQAGEALGEFVRRADAALYRAKNAGRDRVWAATTAAIDQHCT